MKLNIQFLVAIIYLIKYSTQDENQRNIKPKTTKKPFKENKADSEQKNAYNVVCPDEESECPNGFTCCQLSNGQWGCCPLENAVFCSDHLHCCPNGYVCNVKNGRCVISDFKQNTTNPVEKHHLMVVEGPSSSYGSVPCRDGSFCRTGSTCCQLYDGSYGCCPLPNAVCCSDRIHCCPENYTCNVEASRCELHSKLKITTTKLFKKKLSIKPINSRK